MTEDNTIIKVEIDGACMEMRITLDYNDFAEIFKCYYLFDNAPSTIVTADHTLEVIERCAEYLQENTGKKKPVFNGQKIQSLPQLAS